MSVLQWQVFCGLSIELMEANIAAKEGLCFLFTGLIATIVSVKITIVALVVDVSC